MLIALVNHTQKYRSQVTDDAVAQMAGAYAHQIQYDVAPAWGLTPSPVIFYQEETQIPVGAHVIAFMDDSDQQGVLGWHTNDDTGLYGRVFAGPSIDNNGGVIAGDWSVAVTGSHEVLEMLGDPFCNGYAADNKGKLFSVELCDPVEGPSYQVGVVSVSNFIYPAWTNYMAATGSKLDHLGRLTKPFSILHTGYVVWMRNGKEYQKMGEQYPDWRAVGATDTLARRWRKSEQLRYIAGSD